jgi:hypothetical protein
MELLLGIILILAGARLSRPRRLDIHHWHHIVGGGTGEPAKAPEQPSNVIAFKRNSHVSRTA